MGPTSILCAGPFALFPDLLALFVAAVADGGACDPFPSNVLSPCIGFLVPELPFVAHDKLRHSCVADGPRSGDVAEEELGCAELGVEDDRSR